MSTSYLDLEQNFMLKEIISSFLSRTCYLYVETFMHLHMEYIFQSLCVLSWFHWYIEGCCKVEEITSKVLRLLLW